MARTGARPGRQRSPELTTLERRLQNGRRRARGALLLQGALWSTLVSGTVYLVLTLLGQLAGPLSTPAWQWALIALAASLAVAVPWALLRTPSLLDMARRADRRFQLDERASTALETSRAPRPDGEATEIGVALYRDASRHATRIDPRELVRIGFPRQTWLVLGLAATIVVVQLGESQLRALRNRTPTTQETPLSAEELGDTLVNLRRAAELLGREAEEQKDPYLQAVAQAMNDLGARIEQGTIGREEIRFELDRLLEHASRATGLEASPPGGAPDGETSSPATPGQESLSQPQAGVERADLPEATPEISRDDLENNLLQSSPSLTPNLDQLLGRLEQNQEERERRAAAGGNLTNSYADPVELDRSAPALPEGEAAGAGVPIGGAQESTAGDSPLAGEGVQPLEGGPDNATLEGVEVPLDEVTLPSTDTEPGDGIQVEYVPDVRRSEVTDGGLQDGNVWEVGRETELRRDFLTPRDRTIVSRYFEQGDTEAESGADGSRPGSGR